MSGELATPSRRMGKRDHALASIRGEIGRAIEDLDAGIRTEPFTCLWIGAEHNVRITVTKEEKR